MRRFVVIALLLAFSGADAMAQTPTPTAKPGKTGEAAKNASRSVSGTVKASSLDTLVVAGRDKGKDTEWTFLVEPTTNIRKGGKSIVAGDIKPGETVQVRFTEQGGKAMATSIRVKGGITAKKTKS